MVHYDEKQYQWLKEHYGSTASYYYKGRQEAYEQIDDIVDFCRGKLTMNEMLALLDIAYPHAESAKIKSESEERTDEEK